MNIQVRAYTEKDLPDMIRIWNEVVEDGVAFPQEEFLTEKTGKTFFAEQTYSAVAEDAETGKVYGLYILHPNNIGRCGHICNASYAVSRDSRGLHIGEKLVSDCLKQGKKHGFGVLQFNAVVANNIHARHLYERLGFIQLGVIPKGFRMKDGTVRQMVFQSQEQGYDDETTEAYTVKYATDQIVDVEQITSLLYVKPGGNLQEPEEDELVEVKLPE